VLNDLAEHAWPARRYSTDIALVFGSCLVLACLAIAVGRQPGSIATIWPANGATIALIASAPRPRRWVLLGAAAVGNLIANLLSGDTLAAPNAFEVALGLHLVARTGRVGRFANDRSSFLRVLVAGAFVPPLLGATVGAATLQSLGLASFTGVWDDLYIGAALGSVAMLPLVLALRATTFGASLTRFASPIKLVTLTLVAASTILSLRYLPYPFVAISVVLMVFAFTRPRLTTFANAPVLVASLSLALAFGWYMPIGHNTEVDHVLLFMAALLAIVPAQVVSVVVARQRTLSEMLSAVGSRADDIIVFLDMTGTYRWVNQARELYWGASKEEVLGRTLLENIAKEPFETIAKPMFERARSGRVVRRLVDFDYPVRGRRTTDMLMQPARDEEGHQIGVLYCGTDVTELETSRRELQQLAEQLQSANHSLEQFVRISSHDLREPLNTIVQFCDLINAEQVSKLDASGQLYFTQVRNGAARMKLMLDDVLQFVRLEDTGSAELQRVDLNQLVDEVCSALAAQIQSTGAQLIVGSLGSVQGHRALLSLVLQNLISNAIKFVPTERAPVVDIAATRGGGELRLSVKDNGIGIEARRIEELGTPFRRLHSRRKFEGTGLGLAICKRIAEQLGGRIEIESLPGAGSSFSLVLADAA
jgi:PAS domain S-box-containing protein